MTVTKPWRRVWPCETHTWCSPVTWDTWHRARQTFTLARHGPSVPASCHGHMSHGHNTGPCLQSHDAPLIRSHSRNHVVRTSSSASLCKRLDSKVYYLCYGESRMIMWESITQIVSAIRFSWRYSSLYYISKNFTLMTLKSISAILFFPVIFKFILDIN